MQLGIRDATEEIAIAEAQIIPGAAARNPTA
jgi:hypothetical protein